MKTRTNGWVILALLLAAAVGCNASSGGGGGSGNYVVVGTNSQQAAAWEVLPVAYADCGTGHIAILPGCAPIPVGWFRCPGARLHFEDGTIVIADGNGEVSAQSFPAEARAAGTTEASDQPGVIIDADGYETGVATVGVVEPDGTPGTDNVPIELVVVPEEFEVEAGGLVTLQAIRLNANGDPIPANNVTWTLDPADVGTLEVQSDDQYAVYTAPSSVAAPTEVRITAMILDQSHQIQDTSTGIVLPADPAGGGGGTDCLVISGTLYDIDGVTPLAGGILEMVRPSMCGCHPVVRCARAGPDGHYELHMRPIPAGETVRFHLAVRKPFNEVLAPRHVGIDLATDLPYVDLASGVNAVTLDVRAGPDLCVREPPTPIEDLIRASWHASVRSATPIAVEPGTRVRDLLEGRPVPNPIDRGPFAGWGYGYTAEGALVLINPCMLERIVIVSDPVDADLHRFAHEVLIRGDGPLPLLQADFPVCGCEYWQPIRAGAFRDTRDAATGRIDRIDGFIDHFVPWVDAPMTRTTLAWVADPASPGSANLTWDLYGPAFFEPLPEAGLMPSPANEPFPVHIAQLDAYRTFFPARPGTTDTVVTANGSGSVYLPTGDVLWSFDLAGSALADGTGAFVVRDTTVGTFHEGVEVRIELVPRPLSQPADLLPPEVARGSVVRPTPAGPVPVAFFSIRLDGIILVFETAVDQAAGTNPTVVMAGGE